MAIAARLVLLSKGVSARRPQFAFQRHHRNPAIVLFPVRSLFSSNISS